MKTIYYHYYRLVLTACRSLRSPAETCVLAKLDALGEGFDQPLQSDKEKIASENHKTRELQNHGSTQEANERMKDHLSNCYPGFTVGFENIDFEIPRKNMTLGKQNQDLH